MSMTASRPAPSSRSHTRVLIIEDHQLFAESLDLALTLEGYDVRRLSVPDGETSLAALLSESIRVRPQVVLLDLDLGDFGDGMSAIAPMVRAGADVVVLTGASSRARWGECLRHGARTVVSKADQLNEILSTVRRLHQGLPVLSLKARESLLRTFSQQRQAHTAALAGLDQLTRRERQVLGRLMAGRTVREIAMLDVVAEATVRTQVKSILSKLDVSSQVAAVGLAHQVGWNAPSS